ncbi:MAG: molecular chaperone DnaK [Planctomycetes bacterium]|nr:molecular chaperone DnaK [Planctomycetota bacterium]
MERVIGIDLGTTNSCVAVIENGEPVVLRNSEGGRTTPSVVAFGSDGDRYVGEVAKRQALTNPRNTVTSIKRFMGRKYDEVRREAELVPFAVRADLLGRAIVELDGREVAPQEISAMILQKMKQTAEDALGCDVARAVITVPAYFNDAQRQATKDAGRIAGLQVLRILNEPTAAALAYGLGRRRDARIAVYDLGGGTFDVSLLQIGEGVFEVLATSGDSHLGGDDFDERVIQWLIGEFHRLQGIDLREDRMAVQRLKEAAEKAKCDLSFSQSALITIPFITVARDGPVHLNMSLSQARLEQLVDDLIERTRLPCEEALAAAGLAPKDIDEVILVGGQTRMPAVQRLVNRIFGVPIHRGVNPDEVVAIGAAIQGGVLAGEVDRLVLVDVIPHSLGVETEGGLCTCLIERNTTIPAQKSEIFTTARDGQDRVEIRVLQGERPLASDNKLIGHFQLTGIRPAPRGVPQVEVTFDLDANGILNVSAKDLSTGKEQAIRIEYASGLSEEELTRMEDEADRFAREARTRKARLEARNEAERVAFDARKVLGASENSLSPAYRESLLRGVGRIEAALASGDLLEIREATEELRSLREQIGG